MEEDDDDDDEDDVLDVPDLSDSEISPSSGNAARLRELRLPFDNRPLVSTGNTMSQLTQRSDK